MAYIKKIRFDHTDDTNGGCTCDRCGQYIRNIYTVTYTDGVVMHFGIDCFEKLNKASKLTTQGMKIMRKALRNIEFYSEKLNEWKNGVWTEENCIAWQIEKEDKLSYWSDKTFEEYKDWHINEFYPARFAEAQKQIDRFRKIDFKR